MDNLENTSVNTENTENNEVKTYTEEEVLKLIQAEADRRTNQALATQKKKYEKQLSLEKLDGAEREKAEKDNRIAELEEMVRTMNIDRNRSELKSVLSSRGLSAEFADIIAITDDIEASQLNIDKLDKLFKEAVKLEVEKRLAGSAPKGNGTTAHTLTKEDISKMSIRELQALKASNPEIYANLYN